MLYTLYLSHLETVVDLQNYQIQKMWEVVILQTLRTTHVSLPQLVLKAQLTSLELEGPSQLGALPHVFFV